MSKLKVAIALGAGILGLSLLGDAKKASTSPAPTLPPAAPKLPSIKPKRKPRSAKPLTPMTKEQAAAALAQVWPMVEANRATEDQMADALDWARQLGDTEKIAVLEFKLGA
jgi:hypothetical protein